MPRIRDEILNCVIYLYRSVHEAEEGINIGGSGFLVGIAGKLDPEAIHVYAATNKHVIEAGAIHVRMNTEGGRKLIMAAKKEMWQVSDEDDLAVVRLAPIPTEAKMLALSTECLLTRENIKEHGIGVGDEVLMLGRFISREGQQQNAPTARFGHISQMMGDPIETDAGHVQQEAILCEIRSIGGFSGSPVFIIPNPIYAREGKPLPTDRGVLLGVDFCHVPSWVNASDSTGQKNPHIRVPLNSGMAGVIPAWRLHRLLFSEGAIKQRREAEENGESRGS
jgi:hypothetical protein